MRRTLHWLTFTSSGQVAGTLAAFALILFVIAVAVEGFAKFVDQRGYHVHVTLADVNTLYDHQTVKLNGVTVGQVDDLSPNYAARAVDVNLGITPDHAPLHRGARFSVHSSGLFAEQYVKIVDGPAGAPALPDGAAIPVSETIPAVGIDTVVDTLDATTRAEIRTLVTQARTGLDGQSAADLNASLGALHQAVEALDPAVTAFSQRTGAIDSMISDYDALGTKVASDRAALTRTLPQLEQAFATLDTHRDEVSQALQTAASTMVTASTVVTQRVPELRSTFVELPGMLRVVDSMLGELNPLLARIEPAAPQIRQLLVELQRSFGDSDQFGSYLRVLPQFGAGSIEEGVPGQRFPDPGFPPSTSPPSAPPGASHSAAPAPGARDRNADAWKELFK
ncbi:MAG TPA: MlaD family protein [Candidatus Dormibacteraeota bacterium]|jgi:phospholipid/cholesterol/gamma-HCH transport system substrate-binding protein